MRHPQSNCQCAGRVIGLDDERVPLHHHAEAGDELAVGELIGKRGIEADDDVQVDAVVLINEYQPPSTSDQSILWRP